MEPNKRDPYLSACRLYYNLLQTQGEVDKIKEVLGIPKDKSKIDKGFSILDNAGIPLVDACDEIGKYTKEDLKQLKEKGYTIFEPLLSEKRVVGSGPHTISDIFLESSHHTIRDIKDIMIYRLDGYLRREINEKTAEAVCDYAYEIAMAAGILATYTQISEHEVLEEGTYTTTIHKASINDMPKIESPDATQSELSNIINTITKQLPSLKGWEGWYSTYISQRKAGEKIDIDEFCNGRAFMISSQKNLLRKYIEDYEKTGIQVHFLS